MLSRNLYDRYFIPEPADGKPVWFFIFNGNKLLVKVTGDNITVPVKTTIDELKIRTLAKFYLGKLDGYDCYCIDTGDNAATQEGMVFRKFYTLLGQIDEEIFMLAGKAYHILNWDKKNRYCGTCGANTETKLDELAKVCHKCGNIIYPKISPAVIVAVLKGNEILLAQAKNFKENMYSLVAGFVEPGETFEDCVQREVFEEVGIKVKNLKYFGSQPWPFPDSLMVGYTAEYESGEILIDGNEIISAGWFTSRNMPNTPTGGSIAGQIINWFCKNFGNMS